MTKLSTNSAKNKLVSTPQRIWAVLPAAGIGRRMGAQIPKQYLPLAGKCVIEHSIDVLCAEPRIDAIVVAVAENDSNWQQLNFTQRERIIEVPGGAERAESVFNALCYLLEKSTASDWVLVHDAVRPCLNAKDLKALMATALDTEDGAILAVPVRDTMKRVSENQIYETISRENLWHAQTPQMFPLLKLYHALERAQKMGVTVTDEAQAMERVGFRPVVVEGRMDNIKITRPEDLQQANFYLQTLEMAP